jgi:uncharacterized protein (TIGR00251 family)
VTAGAVPFTAGADGLRLAVRLTPRSSAERITGLALEADGGAALKVAVNAPPEDGKANAALLKLLARRFGLPRGDLEIVLGATQRHKIVHIAGDATTLAPRIEEALRPWLTPE